MDSKAFLNWESGVLSKAEEVELFEELVHSGEIKTMPCRYEVRAKELVDAGLIEPPDGVS